MPASAKKTKKPQTLDELLGSSSDESESDSFALDPQDKQGGDINSDTDDTFGNIPVLASPKKAKAKATTTAPASSSSKASTASKTKATAAAPAPAVKAVSPASTEIEKTGEEERDEEEGEDSFTVVLPSSWLATGQPPPGDCNVLIQVDPNDAARLDYEGTSGAIGRFEAGPNGIVLDLKGHQYQGSLLPGPTAMIVALAKGKHLRVEGVTDEFATLVQTQDMMAKLDGIVTGAQMDDGYKVVDENVNRVERNKGGGDAGNTNAESSSSQKGGADTKRGGGASTKGGGSKPPAKRRKKSTS